MSDYYSGATDAGSTSLKNNAVLVYILYLVNLAVPFVGIVGVIIAYANRDKAPAGPRSHFIYQIHTFWLGLLYSLVTALLCFVVIGFFLIPLLYAWLIARSAVGLVRANENKPINNPRDWLLW